MFNDFALLWLRVSTSLLLFWTNGWPKIAHYASELQAIDDPLGLGKSVTLWLALFAEVLCPAAIALGFLTRLACVPVIVLLFVTLLGVHGDWTLAQGQFGWLYLIVHVALLFSGAGAWSIDARWMRALTTWRPTLLRAGERAVR
jgi:putative oxidoreductase